MRSRAHLPAFVAIVAAGLAACNGVVAIAIPEPNPSPEAGGGDDASAEEGGGRDTGADALVEVAVDAFTNPGCPSCPPVSDPYWDSIFPEAGVVPGDGGPGDASVCGLIVRGAGDRFQPAFVTKEVYDALVARGGSSNVCTAVCGVGACVAAIADLGEAGVEAGAPCVPDSGVYRINCVVGGRSVDGMTLERGRGVTLGGVYLAEQAALEAASVTAFEVLAAQLTHLGAPRDLVDDCLVAAREEERHTAVVSALAMRLGGQIRPARFELRRDKDLLSLAIENAVEGVVRETLAASIAVYQASVAATPELRMHLAGIARDEISHALLSRRIHAWALAKLTAEERSCVREAMADAIEELRSFEGTLTSSVRDASLAVIGAPDAAATHAIRTSLVEGLWNDELAAA